MATFLNSHSLHYENVNLIAKKPGVIESRKDVPNEIYRVVVAPMTALFCEEFVIEAARCGLSTAIPRFGSIENRTNLHSLFETNKQNSNQKCFVSIGINEVDLKDLIISTESRSWLIDVAFAGIPQLIPFVENLSLQATTNDLMIGNIMSGESFDFLYKKIEQYTNNLFFRVGIGGGGGCSTATKTGFTRSPITELNEIFKRRNEIEAELKYSTDAKIVADGGIKEGSHVNKAFGVGADYVMMGSYFSKAAEADTNLRGDGTYWGLASKKQIGISGLDKTAFYEGKVNKINKHEIRPLKELVDELWAGISSGVSYSGYRTLSEFVGKGIFEIKS